MSNNNKYRKLSIIIMSIMISLIIIPLVVLGFEFLSEEQSKPVTDNTNNSSYITTTILSTTPIVTTTKLTTTEIITTTKIMTTITITTTTTTTISEIIPEVEIQYEEEEIETEIVTEPEEFETETTESEDKSEESAEESLTYSGTFVAKWYDNRGLGYSEDNTLYGYYGRDLISGYSVASNYFAGGTILYIEGGGLDGYYKVDDTGAMTDQVIDFYYQRRSDIPSNFKRDGKYNIEVYIVN